MDGLPKTNNSVEGWHRGFEEQVAAHHPNIWKFINCIKKEQSLNEVRFEQYISGEESQKKKRKYRDTADRIQRLVNEYTNNNVLDFLRGIAHNISF